MRDGIETSTRRHRMTRCPAAARLAHVIRYITPASRRQQRGMADHDRLRRPLNAGTRLRARIPHPR
jgi:hypothetical protein